MYEQKKCSLKGDLKSTCFFLPQIDIHRVSAARGQQSEAYGLSARMQWQASKLRSPMKLLELCGEARTHRTSEPKVSVCNLKNIRRESWAVSIPGSLKNCSRFSANIVQVADNDFRFKRSVCSCSSHDSRCFIGLRTFDACHCSLAETPYASLCGPRAADTRWMSICGKEKHVLHQNSFGKALISNHLLDNILSVHTQNYKALLQLLYLVNCIDEGVWLRCFCQHPLF